MVKGQVVDCIQLVMEICTMWQQEQTVTPGRALQMTVVCFGCIQQLRRSYAIISHMQMGRIVAKQILVSPKLTSTNKHHHRSLNFQEHGQEQADQLLAAPATMQ